MISVDEVLKASSQMLQKQLYVIFTSPTGPIDAVLENLEEHLAFQVTLEKEGILYAAGPMWTDDEKNWAGDGLVIIRAASRADAIAIAEKDPMHKSGARSFTVRPWMINEGTVTIKLNKSSQTFAIQ